MVHQEVHLVAPEGILSGGLPLPLVLALSSTPTSESRQSLLSAAACVLSRELVHVVDHAFKDVVEVSLNLVDILVVRTDVLQELRHGGPGDVLVEPPDSLPHLPAPPGDPPEDLLQLLLQLLDRFPDLLPLLLGPPLELLHGDDLPVTDGREGEALGRTDQRQAPLPGLLLQRFQGFLLLLLRLFLEALLSGLVLLALERRPKGRPQLVEKVFDVVPEAPADPGGKHQRPGTVRIVEVVDVAEVRGDRGTLGPPLEVVDHDGALVGLFRPQRVDVESLSPNADPELNGPDDPDLADDLLDLLQLLGGVEVQDPWVGPGEERVRSESELGHGARVVCLISQKWISSRRRAGAARPPRGETVTVRDPHGAMGRSHPRRGQVAAAGSGRVPGARRRPGGKRLEEALEEVLQRTGVHRDVHLGVKSVGPVEQPEGGAAQLVQGVDRKSLDAQARPGRVVALQATVLCLEHHAEEVEPRNPPLDPDLQVHVVAGGGVRRHVFQVGDHRPGVTVETDLGRHPGLHEDPSPVGQPEMPHGSEDGGDAAVPEGIGNTLVARPEVGEVHLLLSRPRVGQNGQEDHTETGRASSHTR